MSTREAVVLNSPEDREKVVRWARHVSDGTIVEFRKSTRSHEQNAKMHAMLGEVSDQVVWYGQKLKVEDWKNMFTASLRKASVVPGIDPGTVVPLGIHTSTMTIDEMSNMIELIYAFGAENNVTFKEPKPENTNSDNETPAPSSDNAGMTPVDEAGADDVPASDAPASTDPEIRQHFIDFARKALKTAGDDQLTAEQRTDALENMVLDYRDVIPESLWGKLSGIKVPVQYVLLGKRTIDQARTYIAKDLLDCPEAEIGGAA
ncbi:hypothetical protein DXM27_10380 [Rhizobium rhizogenes]|uniref:Recombinase n=1 Tax=Rhizobium rhizogenes TaxID=359 RepID=A0AA88JTF3_RHIRH|nr:recombination protein NinB [Rhizobium rhizogenes]KAA3503255.1 hypothetical protein DXM27_10380 [Rhizobium rhizogenes]